MASVLVGALVLVSVFGPKLGAVDLIAVGDGLAIAFVLLGARGRLRLPAAYRHLAVVATLYLAYSYFVYVLNGSRDVYVIARALRMWVSTVALGLVFCNLRFRAKQVADIVLVVLLVHAAVVLAQTAQPVLKVPIGALYGFDKPQQPLRAFGLTGGYDGAGMLCLAGAVLSASLIGAGHRVARYYVALVFFGGAALFTGRTAMVALAAVVVPASAHYMWVQRGTKRLLAGALLVGMAASAWVYVAPVLISTVPQLASLGSAPQAVRYQSTYASATIDVVLKMWRFPPDALDAVVGSGVNPGNIDLGYVKMVFMTGLVGLVTALWFYGYMAVVADALRRRLAVSAVADRGSDERACLLAVIGYVGLMLAFNLKSLFFFSRSTHEVAIVLFCGVYAAVHRRLGDERARAVLAAGGAPAASPIE